MTTPETTKEQWLQRIEAWHDSGLSQKAWCRQNGVRTSQPGYWKKKLCEGISRISRSGGVDYTLVKLAFTFYCCHPQTILQLETGNPRRNHAVIFLLSNRRHGIPVNIH